MTIFGINLNFTASGVSIPLQLAELQEQGFRTVRLNIIRYNTSQAAIDAWRGYTQIALNMGFDKVIWGFGAGTGLTASNYTAYADGIKEQAVWFQAQGNPRLEFQIGNEEELHHDASLPNGPLRANLRALSVDVKKIYKDGPISYASSIFTGNEVQAWINEGIGSLDRISFNLYGSDKVFKSSAEAIVSGFGSRGFVSEWGTNNGYIDFNNEELYQQAISKRRRMLVDAGMGETYYYNYMESGNKWGMKMYPITGDFRTAFPLIRGVRSYFVGNPNGAVVRAKTPARANTPIRGEIPARSDAV